MLTSKHKIRAKEIVDGMRNGLQDSDLKEKYGLSSKGLQRLLKKLVDSGSIDHMELYEMSETYREAVDITANRENVRIDVTFPFRIFEIGSSNKGLVRDISETGLRLAGIESRVGELKIFCLPLDHLMAADPIFLQARCRWVRTKGHGFEYPVAGFEIINMSERSERDLRNFVRLFHIGQDSPADNMGEDRQ